MLMRLISLQQQQMMPQTKQLQQAPQPLMPQAVLVLQLKMLQFMIHRQQVMLRKPLE